MCVLSSAGRAERCQSYMNRTIKSTYIDINTGYLYFLDKTHPLATTNGKVALHRHLASIKLGRWLLTTEHVHHIDGNKLNNEPSNLEILTRSEHSKIHCLERGMLVCSDKNCPICGCIFTQKDTQQVYCSNKCAATSTVKNTSLTKEYLELLLPEHSWTSLGKLLGYSDNGIKKRCKALGVDLGLIKTKRV